jgi:hypothetical protein
MTLQEKSLYHQIHPLKLATDGGATPPMQGLRLAGFIVMAVGAWVHRVWLIPLGFDVVVLGWLRGVIFH